MYYYIFDKDGYLLMALSDNGEVGIEDYQVCYPDCTILELPRDDNIKNHRLINGELVKIPDNELQEMRTYGHILSDEERQSIEEENELAKLRPTREEVARAENQLMMLDMLEELKDE